MPGRRIQEASHILCQADTVFPELRSVEVKIAVMLLHISANGIIRILLFANLLPEWGIIVLLEFRNIIVQITST